MNITSNVANMSPMHFRCPPPKGKYLKERITVLAASRFHYIMHKLLNIGRNHANRLNTGNVPEVLIRLIRVRSI